MGSDGPRANPAAPLCGEPTDRITSRTNVTTSAAYQDHDFRSASAKEPLTNARSKSKTTKGAETMTSFEAMPPRHETAARVNHKIRYVDTVVWEPSPALSATG